jgi:CheY-like chemotaxis protein
MSAPFILYVEDDQNDVYLLRYALKAGAVPAEIVHVSTSQQFSAAIEHIEPDLILADGNVPGFDTTAALELARKRCPRAPFLCLTGLLNEQRAAAMIAAGAAKCLSKNDRVGLASAIRAALAARRGPLVE